MSLPTVARRSVLLFALAVLSACAVASLTAPGPTVDATAPVEVAVLVPLGSADPAREALGQSLADAARLAAGDLSGVTVNLTVYPTGGEPPRAAQAATQAVAAGADIILGPLFATETAAVAPIATAASIPVLSLSNTPDIAGGNVYILGNTFDSTARRIVSYTVAQGLTYLAIVYPQGIDGERAAAAARRAASAAGATVVAAKSYPLSVEGITDTMPGIARDLRGAGAKAVILTDGPTAGLTFTTETLRGLGLRAGAVQFAGLQRWDISPQAMAQPSLQGGWFAAPDQALAAQFEGRFASAYGRDPHPVAGLAFDGVAAIAALVAEARDERRNDPFSAARLTKPTGFAGVMGIFRFTRDGQNQRALAIYEVADGAARQIDPAPRSFDARGS